jgi:elongation factor G
MQVESSDQIRNVAVVGHNDTGKTTLISSILLAGGVANRLAKVEEGNTVTDYDPEEIARGYSIGLGVCFAPWRKHKINLIDCPGAGIFMTESRAGLRAADTALLCVNAAAGIQVTTEKVWGYADRMGLPTAFMLTKVDRENTDLDASVEQLREKFGRGVVAVQLPIGSEQGFLGVVDLVSGKARMYERDGDGKGQKATVPDELKAQVEEHRAALVEAVAESDEALMESFFEEGDLSEEQLREGLKAAINSRGLFPVMVSSGLHGIGTAALLDFLVDVCPSPLETVGLPGSQEGTEVLTGGAEGPATALVFKTLNDPFAGKITLLRVVRGTLESDTTYTNTSLGVDERLGHLLAMQGKQGESVARLLTGDLGGVAKLKSTQSGQTIAAKGESLVLDWVRIPVPAISFAIEPKSKGDEEKIGDSCAKLVEEDQALSAGRDPQTGEFLLSGTGQLHVEIAVAKLKSRFKVEVILHPPKVPYMETIRKAVEAHGRHKKQSGGRGQFADCKIAMEPLPRGEQFEFKDEIFGGSIPQSYRPAVEKGILEAAQRGYLAGHPVVDFRVRLLDGQYHDVDSSEMAFKIAGSLAFKDAMSRAQPVLLEPVMQVEISTTEDFMGDIMSDLSQRRGKPQGMEAGARGAQVIHATVPMAEMLNYETSLRSMTQGRSSFTMEFSHYEDVPRQIQEKLVREAQSEAES